MRPEHVRLSTERPPQDRPALPVRVREETFQGSVVRYQLDGPDGRTLAALVPLEEREDVHPGVDAWASWLPEWAYLLPAGPDAEALVAPDGSFIDPTDG